MFKCCDCKNPADLSLTLSFDDIGEPPLHFCRKCGPKVHKAVKMLEEASTNPQVAKKLLQKMNSKLN